MQGRGSDREALGQFDNDPLGRRSKIGPVALAAPDNRELVATDPADLALFSDPRALSRAAPQKVCQMVQDWFAAQLAVKDEDVQLRLLVEALKPVVAG
jgi:hypothetical protein